MTVLSTEEMERLHRLVSWEMPSGMTTAAAAGKACVWCGGPLGEDRARLQTSVPRLGCGRCYSARLAWYITWYDWHRHVSSCTTACQQARVCHVGYGLRAVHDVTIAAAGKEAPQCVSCHHPIHVGEMTVPVRWEGTSQDHLGYAHTQCVMTRAAVR
ncbi:hypothetical protein [Streptomyces roseochromogenus]|uniref:Uncharacterized protein n=1 Tax=Streptomyces roseochromogenus subsp. oscitans DS 12.976 TaxID=1352936 RepID=V6K617_STRRC|nr:hypothetical protein [Streptomyces roseochromogenus]EST24409.1 hypothetical protein M878_30825 [Streptomyces roseochromogenus subsp. oscitans DS 12.976]